MTDLLFEYLDLPESTGLAQAVRWVADRALIPTAEDQLATHDFIDVEADEYRRARRDLVLALRNQEIRARGDVEIYTSACRLFDELNADPSGTGTDWDAYLKEKLEAAEPSPSGQDVVVARDEPIPWSFWDEGWIDWPRGLLHYHTGHPLQSRITPLSVDVSDLLRMFPKDRAAVTPRATPSKIGRPAKFDWDAFHVEITVIATQKRLPEKMAELERVMSRWCRQNWGGSPTESQIRAKISPIYQRLRKAEKADK